MAKGQAADGADGASAESVAVETPIIIQKYLPRREDILPALRRVCEIIYKGEVHTIAEWDDIINRRLTRPAD